MNEPKLSVTLEEPKFLSEIKAYVDLLHVALELRYLLIRALESGDKLARVEDLSASRASVVLGLEPRDKLADFLAALRASKIYPLIVEESHSASVSAPGVEVNGAESAK